MKNQVTSIEQSRLLIGLGVPAEKASMGWFGPNYDVLCNKDAADNYTMTELGEYWQDSDYIPAFTVVDLLGMLPAGVTYGRLHITHSTYSKGEDWRVFYKRNGVSKGYIASFGDRALIRPACDMIEWLLSNGYKLND